MYFLIIKHVIGSLVTWKTFSSNFLNQVEISIWGISQLIALCISSQVQKKRVSDDLGFEKLSKDNKTGRKLFLSGNLNSEQNI